MAEGLWLQTLLVVSVVQYCPAMMTTREVPSSEMYFYCNQNAYLLRVWSSNGNKQDGCSRQQEYKGSRPKLFDHVQVWSFYGLTSGRKLLEKALRPNVWVDGGAGHQLMLWHNWKALIIAGLNIQETRNSFLGVRFRTTKRSMNQNYPQKSSAHATDIVIVVTYTPTTLYNICRNLLTHWKSTQIEEYCRIRNSPKRSWATW